MRCEEFESRLNDLLDARRALFVDAGLADPVLADAGLAEHAAVCSACASIARGYETLSEGVSAWERVDLSADLTGRVVRQWERARAEAAQSRADTADWDSAELPAMRPVGVQKPMPAVARAGGFWSSRRELVLASAALATAAALLVISGVGRNSLTSPQGPDSSNDVRLAQAVRPAPEKSPVEKSPSSPLTVQQPGTTQFALTSLPIVEQMTETYQPLLAETDRAIRKSLGLPATPGGPMITSTESMGLVTQPDPDDVEPTWDAFMPEQVAPVTQSAVRSVVALLRVLPGVEPAQ